MPDRIHGANLDETEWRVRNHGDGTVSLAVSSSVRGGALADASGTTDATPGTSAVVLAADPDREFLRVTNLSDTATLWVNYGAPATEGPGSEPVPPGGNVSYEAWCPTGAVHVAADEASAPFTLKHG